MTPKPSLSSWEELIKQFDATEQEARFLAKLLSNEELSETLKDLRSLLTTAKEEGREEALKQLKAEGLELLATLREPRGRFPSISKDAKM